MRAPSWLHYYFESFRSRRTLRKTDQMRAVAFVLDGRVFAGISWRSPR